MKQRCDVFHDNESRSYHANDPGVFAPQPGPFAFDSGTLPGVADVLAREPSADNIRSLKAFSRECFNVVPLRHVGPVFRQYLPAVRVNFHLPHAPHSGSLEAEVKATDASKQ
jgi:hypothetical protein